MNRNITKDATKALVVNALTKHYATPQGNLTVLDGVSFHVDQGESLSVVGASGSGKTTLLGLCAGLDLPSSGTVEVLGQPLHAMDEEERAAFRRDHVGFVFQSFQLLPTLTAIENVMLPLELRRLRGARAQAQAMLERVGLAQRADHYPVQLSGGEQQRVALARAFINQPSILFADEPTGNLDTRTGARIEEMLFELNRESATTLILVTHDMELAHRTDRQVQLSHGRQAETTIAQEPR